MHKRLFIPGPVEIDQDILIAMATPMIGHRMKEYAVLHAGVREKLRPLLKTEGKIFFSTSSAFGAMEGAVRNLVYKRCLNLCNGAFSDKWHGVTKSCGIEADALRFDWGQPVSPEALDRTLSIGGYDAVTLIHNETSTGVMSDLAAIAAVMRKYPDVIFIVDTVSSMSALDIPIDEYGIDCCIFGVQKAFALPPGLAVFTASEKALERASEVEGRGYYFDFLEFALADQKDNTPSTPAISLLYALDAQLDRMYKEGFAKRFERHDQMANMVRIWATQNGFELFPTDGAYSQTLTCIKNTRGIDLAGLKKRLGELEYAIDDGYGKIKGQTFRIAHMGDLLPKDLQEFLNVFTTEMEQFRPAA